MVSDTYLSTSSGIFPLAATPTTTTTTTASTASRTTSSSTHGPLRFIRNMPSPRSSPGLRPTSPLSPGYKGASAFDSLQPPSPRGMQSRPSAQRRPQANSLKLPPLPRFHPANFPSNHSSIQSTPDGISPQPHGPLSPRAYTHHHNLQRQMYLSQREIMASALRASSPSQAGRPVSPRLVPMGSPGPVTPLELELQEDDGYLIAGARNAAAENGNAVPDDVVQAMIEEELRRQSSPRQLNQTQHDRR